MATISGAEYIAKSLDAYGVRAVFFVPTILSRTLYELETHTSIARIVTHGEKAAAYMADGYARASNQPGVCMAQNVGAANLAAGLRDPFLGCSPVIAMTGGPYAWSRSRNFYQEIEDFPLFKPVTKFSAQIPDVTRLPDLLEHAFRSATVATKGPVHLELGGHTGDILENQHTDVPLPTQLSSAAQQRPLLASGAVASAVSALKNSHRPVIVAGGGVRESGAGAEVIAIAEMLGIPIATSLNGKDTIPGDHELNIGVPGLYARECANQIIMEADLVFYVGSQTGSQVTLSWTVPPPLTQVIQLDMDASELGRHYTNTIGLLCDAKAGLEQLRTACIRETFTRRDQWVMRAQELVRRWREKVRPDMESDHTPIRPERLCAELNDLLPHDSLLVSDTGHAGMWTGGFIDLKSPAQGFIRAAGSLGWGLPAALGAQIALPNRRVVLFTGDGGLWYHLSELETAARWRIPAIIVVNNNRSLNQEIGPYTEAYGGELHGRHAELWHFQDIDLAAVAESLGVTGIRVRKPGEFAGAMDKALATQGPVLIDVVSDMDIMAPRGHDRRADG